MKLPKLIILDRDGVINQDSDNYIKNLDEFIVYPDSPKAISLLNQAGIKVAIATNQSGISRGFYDQDMLTKMHQKLNDLLTKENAFIDYITFCPHTPDLNCDCRKPKPGMLIDCVKHFNYSFSKCLFVGDSFTDILAAAACDMPFALVKSGKGMRTIKTLSAQTEIILNNIHDNLYSFAQTISHE